MYKKVYFYIDGDYLYGRGFSSREAERIFHDEITNIFMALGWQVKAGKLSGESYSAYKGKQELYLHPMAFSGVILTEEIPAISNSLASAKCFRLRNVEEFEEYADMSNEEYLSYLDSKREDMIQAILDNYRTKRSNLYITDDLTRRIGDPFRIRRLISKNNTVGDLAYIRIVELTKGLITEGRLIITNTRRGPGIRTAMTNRERLANQISMTGLNKT